MRLRNADDADGDALAHEPPDDVPADVMGIRPPLFQLIARPKLIAMQSRASWGPQLSMFRNVGALVKAV
jgi:hypothetical protein